MTYRFARFVVDSDSRQLIADGEEVHLSPKAFSLLLVLIEQRARALSKVELQGHLWPSTFVGETSLSTLVAEVRRALDDLAQGSRYVRTVHRFGYRFVAPVTESQTQPAGFDTGMRIYVTSGGQQFPVPEGEVVIGRGRDAAIRIESGGVSRRHARIVVAGEAVHVEDLGSKNGTFVAGKPVIGRCALKDGDEIRVGTVMLTFRISPATQATRTLNVDSGPA